MSLNILREYLNAIAANLKAGNATEHTHRPALKTLLEASGAQADGGQAQGAISATNEPQRIACGAPDFIVTRGLLPLGYVEAKGVRVTVVSTTRCQPPQIADELRRQADAFIDLSDVMTHFSKPKTAMNQGVARTLDRSDRA